MIVGGHIGIQRTIEGEGRAGEGGDSSERIDPDVVVISLGPNRRDIHIDDGREFFHF